MPRKDKLWVTYYSKVFNSRQQCEQVMLSIVLFAAIGFANALQGIFQEDLGKLDWKMETTSTDVLRSLFVVMTYFISFVNHCKFVFFF